jgi:hypothetical protein
MNVASQARFAPPEANIPGEGLPECQANSTHKMGEVVFLVERALQHHAASHLQTFYVSKVHKK